LRRARGEDVREHGGPRGAAHARTRGGGLGGGGAPGGWTGASTAEGEHPPPSLSLPKPAKTVFHPVMPDEKKQNLIERAKTSRSSCKDCGGVIEKGALRFGLVDFTFHDSGSYKYFHLACANRKKRREVQDLLDQRGDAQEVPRAEIEAALSGGQTSAAPAVDPGALPAWLKDAPAPKEAPPAFAKSAAPPTTPDGKALDAASIAKLVGAMHDSTTKTKKKSAASLEQFAEWLGEAQMRDFSWRLFESWAQEDGQLRHKWLFRALAKSLDDALAFRLGPLVASWMKQNKKAHVEAGCEVLAACGTPAALMEMQRIAQRFHYKGAYNIPAQTLAQVAQDRGLSIAELEDRLVPSLGLDPDGSRVFDLGGRALHLRVDSDLRAELEAEDKTRLKGFPPARKTDDAQKYKDAHAAYDLLRTELETALKTQSQRLEQALATGRTWKRADWDEHLLSHPVMKHLVRRFVWGQGKTAFVIDEQGAPMNVALERAELSKEPIRLVHPAELDETTRNAWSTLLSDFQIIQPFLQIGRPVRAAANEDREKLRTFERGPIEPGKLHGVLNRLGWIKAPPEDMMVRHFYKRFSGHGVTGVIELGPGLYVAGGDDSEQTAEGAFFASLSATTPFSEHIPVTKVSAIPVSEVLHDLEVLSTARND